MFWEISENQFGLPKKSRQNFETFLKIPPSLEKILDPLLYTINIYRNELSFVKPSNQMA